VKGSDGRHALRLALVAGLLALAAPVAVAGTILHVTPDDPLSEVSRRLATDPDVSEVVLAAGTYTQALRIPPFAGAGTRAEGDAGPPGTSPLLVRPADGARVVFDGAIAIGKPHPVKGRPGVYWIAGRDTGAEPPRLWEPAARVRYTLAADLDAVERFAGTYLRRTDASSCTLPTACRPGSA